MSSSVFTPCVLNLIFQIDFHLKYPLCPPFENRFFVFEVATCDLYQQLFYSVLNNPVLNELHRNKHCDRTKFCP